ncbi:MAG TPA: phosphate signaling complex protein PhoU [Burkholderiales bacterium]|nr:phosphate signaling complex protein PhoU [Burkholderiales bacterium]
MMGLLTDREYNSELDKLHDQLLLMGAKVEQMISASMEALVKRDSELARRTIVSDRDVNRMEIEIDDLCLRILARRQPVASDLRLIATGLKIVTDLERIGDSAVNICERIVELNTEPVLKPYVDIPRMAEIVQTMVRDALDAFVNKEPKRAADVVERDRLVDAYYGQVFRELLTYMMEDPRNIYRAVRAQSVAKYLERIGDHATNVAEMVIFMVGGKDVRHVGSMADPEQSRRMPRGVLFLCRQNAARSQMAEALARKLFPPGVNIASAGSEPAKAVNPYAVRVMEEAGIDIAGQRPKGVADVPIGDMDTIVTLCADESCPVVPGGLTHYDWPLEDPAGVQGPEEDVLAAFRKTRDEIRQRIEALLEKVQTGTSAG